MVFSSILCHFFHFMDHNLTAAKAVQFNEAMSHAVQGHPKWMGHCEDFWQNMVLWRREWHLLQYSCLENSMKQPILMWTVWKDKKMTSEDEPPQVGRCPYTIGKEWRVIPNSSRKKWSSQAKVETTLSCGCVWWWMNRNLDCQVHESRYMRGGQAGDSKSEDQHLRNPWIKMDENGQI